MERMREGIKKRSDREKRRREREFADTLRSA